MTNIKKQLVTNTLTHWISLLCNTPISLILVPYLIKSLGKDGYGLIGLVGVIISFSAVADFGLRQALARELSGKSAEDDILGFRILSSTAFVLYVAIAILLIIINISLASIFTEIFNIPESLKLTAIRLIRYYGSFSIAHSFIIPVFTAGLQSKMKYNVINNISTSIRLSSGIMLLFLLSVCTFDPFIIWVLVMIFVNIIKVILLYHFYRKYCYDGYIGLKYVNFKYMKPLFSLSGYMYVLQLTSYLSVRIDPLVLSYFLGPSAITLYQSGSKVPQILKPLTLSMSTQTLPLTTKYHIKNQKQSQYRALIYGSHYTMLIGVIFSAGIILFADKFSLLWLYDALGSDYVIVAKMMKIIAVIDMIDYAGAMHWSIVLGMKKLKFSLLTQVPSAILNVLLSIYFVGYTNLGIIGVLVSTLIINSIRRPITAWYICRLLDKNLLVYFKKAYLPSLLLLMMLLLYKFVVSRYDYVNWFDLTKLVVLYGVYASILVAFFERKLLLNFLVPKLKKIHSRR